MVRLPPPQPFMGQIGGEFPPLLCILSTLAAVLLICSRRHITEPVNYGASPKANVSWQPSTRTALCPNKDDPRAQQPWD